MQITHWTTAIKADWTRALDLKELKLSHGSLQILVEEEESGKLWRFEFSPFQAWKMTTEECAGTLMSVLPDQGGLFIIEASPWIDELGACKILERSKHFVVCCYDEILEVLAWDCTITLTR